MRNRFATDRKFALSQHDVLTIGNAIVDVIARTEDDFLVKHGMHKGGMALIDAIPPARKFFMREAAGGSGDMPKLLKGEALSV